MPSNPKVGSRENSFSFLTFLHQPPVGHRCASHPIQHATMEPDTTRSLPQLPTEIIREIFTLLPQKDLRRFRFLNHRLGDVATTLVFRHVVLGGQRVEAEKFIFIAQSEKLRPFVREITCDPEVPLGISPYAPLDEIENHEQDSFLATFLIALPYIQRFRNLKRLHVHFAPIYTRTDSSTRSSGSHWVPEWAHDLGDEFDPPELGSEDRPPYRDCDLVRVLQCTDFRYRVLDTVFQCIAGTWSTQRQKHVDSSLMHLGRYPFSELVVDTFNPTRPSLGPVLLEALEITGLVYHEEQRLTNTDHFRRVIALGSLTSLTLSIVRAPGPEAVEAYDDGELEMYSNLPRTWLNPSLASHLKVLCLWGQRDYWGWCPRMDFRKMRLQEGSHSALPCLKALKLRCYVFSHEWQVDWIASLGCNGNGSGLEELYLICCPILVSASVYPSQQAHDTSSTNQSHEEDDDKITVSDEGYLKTDLMPEDDELNSGQVELFFSLRWHKVLSVWREKMSKLLIFTYIPVWDSLSHVDTSWLEGCGWEKVLAFVDPLRGATTLHPLSRIQRFQYLRGPEYWAPGNSSRYETSMNSRYGRDEGPYVRFDVDGRVHGGCSAWEKWTPKTWAESPEHSHLPYEEDLKEKDKAAFELFTDIVVARYKGG